MSALEDPILNRRLHIVDVKEPTEAQLVQDILPVVASKLEHFYGIEIANEVLITAIRQTQHDSVGQPAAAICVLEQALAKAKVRNLHVLGPDDMIKP